MTQARDRRTSMGSQVADGVSVFGLVPGCAIMNREQFGFALCSNFRNRYE